MNPNHCSELAPTDLQHTRSDFLSMNKCISGSVWRLLSDRQSNDETNDVTKLPIG